MLSLPAVLVSTALALAPPADEAAPSPAVPASETEQGAPGEPAPQPKTSRKGLAMFGVGVASAAGGIACLSGALLLMIPKTLGTPSDPDTYVPDHTDSFVLLGIGAPLLVAGTVLIAVGASRNAADNRRLAAAQAARLEWTPVVELGRRRASFGVQLRF